MQQKWSLNPKPAIWIMLIVVILDRITKYLVVEFMPLYKSIPVWGETMMLTHVQNTGAAFSMSIGSPLQNRIFFISITLLALLMILYMLKYALHRAQVIGYGFVLGGAIGNLIDRIVFGHVTDFFDMDFPDFIMQRWPIFNIADSAIVIAMAVLIFDLLFVRDHITPKLDSQSTPSIDVSNDTEINNQI